MAKSGKALGKLAPAGCWAWARVLEMGIAWDGEWSAVMGGGRNVRLGVKVDTGARMERGRGREREGERGRDRQRHRDRDRE